MSKSVSNHVLNALPWCLALSWAIKCTGHQVIHLFRNISSSSSVLLNLKHATLIGWNHILNWVGKQGSIILVVFLKKKHYNSFWLFSISYVHLDFICDSSILTGRIIIGLYGQVVPKTVGIVFCLLLFFFFDRASVFYLNYP